jgi:hypothetical protein
MGMRIGTTLAMKPMMLHLSGKLLRSPFGLLTTLVDRMGYTTLSTNTSHLCTSFLNFFNCKIL